MRTLHNIGTSVEEQESASAVRALGLALVQTLVPHKRGLLITCQPSNLDPVQRSIGKCTVDLGRRHDLGKDRRPKAEELEHGRLPLERLQVHEERTGSVGHVGDMKVVLSATGETLGRYRRHYVKLERQWS